MKKIGIYSGTFDPIHDGHIAFAETALAYGLEKVFFLVEPRPRRKQGVRSLEHRLAMTTLAAKGHVGLGVIQLEQHRFTPDGTLPPLAARFHGNTLVLLFGDDVIKHMVDNLASWPHVEAIAANAELLIAARTHQIEPLRQRLDDLKKYGIRFRYDFVEPQRSEVSSSALRQALRKGGSDLPMPKAALAYAREHGLYTSSG